MPDHVPKVEELGVTSAPLKSAAFFIGAHCQKYNGTKMPWYNIPTDLISGHKMISCFARTRIGTPSIV